MNKVITVNLNGTAFQLDEGGYESLRDYLARAEAKLNGADKPEVLADLERAIADKCAGLLRPHKNVVTEAEVMAILNEIGPVQTADGQTIEVEPPKSQPAMSSRFDARTGEVRTRRRFFRIRQGSKWAGICTGLAAYADVDVSLVRVVVVLGTFFTGFFPGLLAYFVATIIVPVAYSDSDLAAAHARPPELRRT
jgi:phage shock protein PspC (stress-responsive transcriptional regulator)